MYSPRLMSGELCSHFMRSAYLPELFGILLHKVHVVFPIYFYSIIYLRLSTHGQLFYTSSYNLIVKYYFIYFMMNFFQLLLLVTLSIGPRQFFWGGVRGWLLSMSLLLGPLSRQIKDMCIPGRQCLCAVFQSYRFHSLTKLLRTAVPNPTSHKCSFIHFLYSQLPLSEFAFLPRTSRPPQ